MKYPCITVLMTVYNGGKYLELAVDSVLKQSYKDFEFLIVEDKSSDGSLEFLRSLRDPRLRVHANPQNVGQTKSLNIGLGLARGQYVARMDADDLACAQWLECLVGFMQKNPDCAVVSPKAAAIDPAGRFLRVLNSPRTKEDIILKSFFASPINHVGSLMRRKVIVEDMKGYDENFKVTADYDLWSRLLRQGHELKHYSKVLVSVRFHGFSLTAIDMGQKVIPETTRIIKENIEHWKQLSLPQDDLLLLWGLMYAPQDFSVEQYHKGKALLGRIYGPCAFLNRQKRIVLAKRIIGKLKKCFL